MSTFGHPPQAGLNGSPLTILRRHFGAKFQTSYILQNYSERCEALINKQINMEFHASYVYMAMVCTNVYYLIYSIW